MRASLLLFALFVSAGSCLAQEDPRAELFGGYSYARTDDLNLHGWNGSIAWKWNSRFGIAGDFSGQYGNVTEFGIDVGTSIHSFLFGPRFSSRTSDRITLFGQAMVGVSRIAANVPLGQIPGVGGISVGTTGLALAGGGGVDASISKKLAVRVFQGDFIHIRAEGEASNIFRISAGLVLRF